MEIKLWKDFRKRRNSTKQPPDSGYITKQVVLKGNCSITSPEFFLADAELYSYLEWNGLYYFITDVSWDINNASYVRCQLDYLASWKTEILNTYSMVKYSTSNYSLLLPDNRIIPKVETITDYDIKGSDVFLSDHHTNEVVILTVLGGATGIMRYVLDETSLQTLFSSLYQQSISIVGSLLLEMSAVMSSIIDVIRIPIEPEDIPSTGPIEIQIGDIMTGYEAAYLVGNYTFERVELEIPWIYNDFRKTSPYTELYLELPFVGIVELNPTDFIDTGIIDIRTSINLYNGHIDYRITSGENSSDIIANYSAQCGGTVPIATMQVQSASQVISGALDVGTKIGSYAVASNLEAANVNAVVNPYEISDLGTFNYATAIGSSMVDFLQAMNTKSANIVGSYSGGYGETLNTNYRVFVRAKTTNCEPLDLNELYGNPLGKVVQIATLTGYVQTIGFDISLHATDNVKLMINQLMDSGVYIE